MRYQRTIERSVDCSGIGLHTGAQVVMRLHPAPEGHGIVFIRTDLKHAAPIRATAAHVASTMLSTSLGREDASVQTVEHLLAACAGLRVDNLLVEVDGPEVPILDGSAAPFAALLQQAGLLCQNRLQPYLRLIRPLQIGRPGQGVALRPAPFPSIRYTINFADAVVGRQQYLYQWAEEEFLREIAPARTFGFVKDVERMRAMGLIKGASLDNAVVVGDEGVLNPQGLRFSDEFVRHKVLDMIGDLSLIGRPLVAQVDAECAGHAMNLEVVRHLLAHPDAWVMVTPESVSEPAVTQTALPLPASISL